MLVAVRLLQQCVILLRLRATGKRDLILLMAKTKKNTLKSKNRAATAVATNDLDGVYLLKLALYVILGSMWLKLSHGQNLTIPIPIGFVVGLLFSSHEHFRIDRKIEYAVLMVAMLAGYFASYGLYIS